MNCPILPEKKCIDSKCSSCDLFKSLIHDPEYENRQKRFVQNATANLIRYMDDVVPGTQSLN